MNKKIAIIGSGISGLTCAHLLSRSNSITLFEAGETLGGHTATLDVDHGGRRWAIDTGFIVFNDRTYPNFRRLLAQLKVRSHPTEMSFSVHNPANGLEYNGHNLDTLFAQRRNLLSIQFLTFLNEILRFNRLCKAQLRRGLIGADHTLGEFLRIHRFSDYFAQHYILPMGAAIWSSSLLGMRQFPLLFFVRFFDHHGLLNISNRPQWYVVSGGSREYIAPMIRSFKERIRLNTPVKAVRRQGDQVHLELASGHKESFDEVILACHSDQALTTLADASVQERQVLGAIPYRNNQVVLHTDTRLLPKNRRAWAAWNYQLDRDPSLPARVTYNMNILQGLPADAPTFCVTLNQGDEVDPDKVIRTFNYAHPVFTRESLNACRRRDTICGRNHTHFAGAYWHNGFHEDGVRSALEVCRRFGETL
ncbi:FAD-dependent oxidoreductase [Ferrimonas sediminicola]|uniref:FAD-dependent oxidoreductase n=1 Tax=Ferrimonas sediminicola TaxID=2569538 RepID=A0A4U1BII6_9GAMM|nr:FAD-dependent oxidoreductase [Ferrimonas sediminicola]TKB50596.1 FAD-dependent oxidoreductase [Ferrimonas sediminicola]